MTKTKYILFTLLISGVSTWATGPLTSDVEGFDQQVAPLLQKYCVECHGAEKQKGKLRFDTIDPNIVTGEHFGIWEDLREAFNTGEMPPEDEPQPTDAERDAMTRWLDTEFKKAKQYGNPNKRGRVRRLTRYELRYALEDLLQVSVEDEVNALPEEGTSHETGLKNSARMLMISSPHLETYLNTILTIIEGMKEEAVFDPHSVQVDIEHLDVNPPATFAQENKKNKPPVAKVQRMGKGVMVERGGYIDLKIPSVSKCKFQTTLTAKADTSGLVEVAIGYQYSEFDPRQNLTRLGSLKIEQSNELQTYTLDSYPNQLSDEITRALDRPFFIRITNKSAENLYLEGFEYHGNVNTDLTANLIPPDIAASAVEGHVREKIYDFLARAFRRPPSDAAFEKYYGIYQRQVKEEKPVLALLSAYKAILCAPEFFYMGVSEAGDPNYRLAEKLAFTLWCSVPDHALLAAASSGSLTTPSVLETQIARMLKDERSRRWVENFTDQWLRTSQLFNVAVDGNYYPRFREPIKDLMHQETYEAVNDVFRNGAPALDLLQANHVFVNQTLAGFYKLKGVKGEAFQKVPVDARSHRGGLLTQGTFLVGNSDGMNSHAILRGVWLADVILNDPPPDPPANVPPFDESIPGFEQMTLNQKLFAHRNNDACRSCHQKIDPWGIPFENYDASGAWREKVLVVSKTAVEQPPTEGKKKKRKKPVFEKKFLEIERAADLPDGVSVDGMDQLKAYLVAHRKHDFAEGLVRRILAYALSRDVDYYDEDLVTQLVERFEQNDYAVPGLIRDIMQTEAILKGQ